METRTAALLAAANMAYVIPKLAGLLERNPIMIGRQETIVRALIEAQFEADADPETQTVH